MSTLKEIERAAEEFSKARATLAEKVMELNTEIDKAKRARIAAIRKAVASATEKQSLLNDLVSASRDLFNKPKTRVLHGIKVGYQKQPGAIDIADEAATVERIKKMFADEPEMLQQLLKTTEKPIKDALGELSGDKLKKLGVKVTDDTDKIIIKAADSEVDKIVDALLKGTGDDE